MSNRINYNINFGDPTILNVSLGVEELAREEVPTFLHDTFFNLDRSWENDIIVMEYMEQYDRVLDYTVKGADPEILSVTSKMGAKQFEIPYIAISTPIDPRKQAYRRPGEVLNSNPAENLNKLLLDTSNNLNRNLLLTREKQCAELINTGAITINEKIEDKVAMQRIATFKDKIKVDSEANWATTSFSILDQLFKHGSAIRRTTSAPLMLILGNDAYSKFIKNEEIIKQLDNRRMFGGEYRPGDTNMVGVAPVGNIMLSGVGEIEVVLYNAYYTTADGKTDNTFVDPKKAILIPKTNIGAINYGQFLVIENNEFTTNTDKVLTKVMADPEKDIIKIIKKSKMIPTPHEKIEWRVIKALD